MSGAVATRLGWLVSVLLLLAGVGYFYAAVPGVPDTLTVGKAQHPWPDGAEYLDAAVSLALDGSYTIHLAGEPHPPRYPFGYSAVVAVALLLGSEPDLAAQRVNWAVGGLLLAFFLGVLWRRGHRLEACLSVALLATLPAFVILSRSPLSEVTSTLVAVVAVWALYVYSEKGSWTFGVVGAFLLGLGLCFRASNIFLFAFVPAAIVARHGWQLRSLVRDQTVLGVCFSLGLLPVFIYNAIAFGHPLQTGYEYWVPFWNASQAFGLHYLEPNLTYFWQELMQREAEFTTATTYGPGQGSYLVPAFVLLAIWAVVQLRNRPRILWFALAGAAYQGLMLFYYYRDARFSFPLMVLTVPLIARGLGETWRHRGRLEGLVAFLLLMATLLGWPSSHGRFESVALLQDVQNEKILPEYEALERFEAMQVQGPKLVLTDIAVPYAHAVLPEGTLVAPLSHDHLYNGNPESFVFESEERTELVESALASGRSVWVLTARMNVFSISSIYTPPEGYAWEVVAQIRYKTGILRLVPLNGSRSSE